MIFAEMIFTWRQCLSLHETFDGTLQRQRSPYASTKKLQSEVKLHSCRIVIENAFGALKQRFRQLYHLKLRNMIRIVQVIHACCVLHNIANKNDLRLFDDPIADDYADDEARHFPINDDIETIEDNYEGRHLRDEI